MKQPKKNKKKERKEKEIMLWNTLWNKDTCEIGTLLICPKGVLVWQVTKARLTRTGTVNDKTDKTLWKASPYCNRPRHALQKAEESNYANRPLNLVESTIRGWERDTLKLSLRYYEGVPRWKSRVTPHTVNWEPNLTSQKAIWFANRLR
jgi:hypothetical protein